ncbi:hypothetical protein ED312_10385 [Sinomicrobium pectinilyticum]|uniref:Calcineurin-like phosphoesterase domain-containing protein n=1 Tax=Sinomicrobium pectinilyticum TaxID=1084421 RepID=A0A3N0EH48_SINP1|nr:metallophosphoesterase [Sinomicrobium pectinilyticum]RNL87210.1 hypothetical protein ED312_10385 [Sinomicrobium pectinilyticum]
MKKIKIPLIVRTVLIFSFLLMNGNVPAQKDTLSILHISDLHVIFNPYAYIPEMMEYRKKKQYDMGETRLRNFLETIPDRTNSDMVVATGDLVDFFESKTVDSTTIDIQPAEFSGLLNDYQIPVLLTLGNHDIFTFDWDNSRDYKLLHNQNHSGRARSLWIKNIPCFSNGTYYSKMVSAGQTDYRLIFLDDSFYQFSPEDKTRIVPYLDKSQLYWLKDQLNASENDIEIIFMHIPFGTKDEKYKNNELYTVIAQNPSCKLIVGGHHHKSIVKKIPAGTHNQIIQVQTDALVKNTENWRLIRLTENNILVSETGKTENELTIDIK